MANEFKYIIDTELRLSKHSLNNLLQEAKTADRTIRRYMDRNGTKMNIPVEIDKTKALNQVKKDAQSIVNSFNNNAVKPKIKIGVELDKDIDALRRKVDTLRSQLGEQNRTQRPAVVRTALEIDRHSKQKVQQEVGRIKATMTVGLRLDQNDLKVIQAQVRNIRADMTAIQQVSRPQAAPAAPAASTTQAAPAQSTMRRFGEHRTAAPAPSSSRRTSSPVSRDWTSAHYDFKERARAIKEQLMGEEKLNAMRNELERTRGKSTKSGKMIVNGDNGVKRTVKITDYSRELENAIRTEEKNMRNHARLSRMAEQAEKQALQGSSAVQQSLGRKSHKDNGIGSRAQQNVMRAQADRIMAQRVSEQKAFEKQKADAEAAARKQAEAIARTSYGKAQPLPQNHPVRQRVASMQQFDSMWEDAHLANRKLDKRRRQQQQNTPFAKSTPLPKYHPVTQAVRAQQDIEKAEKAAYREKAFRENKQTAAEERQRALRENTSVGASQQLPKHHPVRQKVEAQKAEQKMLEDAYKQNRRFNDDLARRAAADRARLENTSYGKTSTLPKHHPVRMELEAQKAAEKQRQRMQNTMQNTKFGSSTPLPRNHPVRQQVEETKKWNQMLEEAQRKNEAFDRQRAQRAQNTSPGASSRLPEHHPVRLRIAEADREKRDQRSAMDAAHREAIRMDRDRDWDQGISRLGPNKRIRVRNDENILRNPDASQNDKDLALQRLRANASSLAQTMGTTLTRSFEVVNRNADGTTSTIRTAQYEFSRFGDELNRSNRFLNTFQNTLQYTAIAGAFYGITTAVMASISYIMEFEAQLARVKMTATDLTNGGIKNTYSNLGSEQTIGSNVRKNVYDLAETHGMSGVRNVLPVYQSVMSRSNLVKDKNGRVDEDMVRTVTDQILQYSTITLGAGAQPDDINKISQDMLSLYQGIARGKASNGSKEHVYEMDRFIDYMANMNNSGVNTNNIMDAMSEIAPDALKKGIDIRDVAGLLGAYNLSDSDASGSSITTVAKTLLGGLARHQSSPNIQKGLKMLDIDTNGMSQQEVFEQVLLRYGDPTRSEGEKEAVARQLSSTTSQGKAMAPKVAKMLDAASSQYYLDFQSAKDDTGTADNAWKPLMETLKADFGKLKSQAEEFVAIMSELGALQGLKLMVSGLGGALSILNTTFGAISQFGAKMQEVTGFNMPKLLVQILAITAGVKGLTMAMNKLGFQAVTRTVGGFLASTVAAPVVLPGNDRESRRRNERNSRRRSGPLGGIGGTVGSLIGWTMYGNRTAPNSRVPLRRGTAGAGRNALPNILARLTTGFGALLPTLIRFGGILARLSAIGAVVTGVVWAGKAIYDWNMKRKQEVARTQIKKFDQKFGADIGTNDSKYEAFTAKYDRWKELSVQRGSGINDKKLAELKALDKEFAEVGIEFTGGKSSSSGGMGLLGGFKKSAPVISYNRVTGEADGKVLTVREEVRLDDKEQEQKMLQELTDRVPLTPMQKLEEAWVIASDSAFEYESQLHTISKLTEDFNRAINRLGFDMAKLEMGQLGAEGTQGAIAAQMGAIQGAMGGLDTTISELKSKRSLFADGASGLQADLDAARSNITSSGVMSSGDLSALDTKFEMAYASGDTDTIMNQYGVDETTMSNYRTSLEKQNKDNNLGWTDEDIDKQVNDRMEQGIAVSNYLAFKQSSIGFLEADKQAEEQILATEMAVLQQEMAYKKLAIALGVAKSGYEVFNAKLSTVQNALGKAQTLVALEDDDTEKVKRQADYLKTMASQLGVYRGQLAGVQNEMASLQSANPDQNFSIDAIYNPADGNLTEQQAIYKELLEKYNGIHTNINSSTIAIKEQSDALKDMVLNSDKYSDVWERVQSRIQLVKDLNKEIASMQVDRGLAGQFAEIRTAVTGGSSIEAKNSRLEAIRDRGLDGYEQIMTSLKTYAGDEKKLAEAYAEINKTLGSEMDSALIQPMKDLIANEFTEAGNLIYDGAGKLDEVLTYWANNITSGIVTPGSAGDLAANNTAFSSDISNAQSIGGFSGGSVKTIPTMSETEAVNAYIEQQFGYKTGTPNHTRMKKQMSLEMSTKEMASEARKNLTPTGNNGTVHEYAAQIDKMFAGTKLSGYGNAYVQSGAKHNIDPRLLASISMAETGGNSAALRDKNNVSGEMMRGGGLRSFGSIEESIESQASFLRRLYFNNGKDTIPEIQKSYAPSGAANDPTGLNNNWVKNVSKYYSDLSGVPQSSLLGGTAISSGGGGGSASTGTGSASYTVKSGDTLSEIAAKYPGVSWQQIQSANGGVNPKSLKVGQKLTIPGQGGGVATGGSGKGILGSSKKTQEVAQHYTTNGWHVSSNFGMRTLNGVTRMHEGVDLNLAGNADNGYKQMAFLGGTVAKVGAHKTAGNYVNIKQDDGTEQRYYHLKNPSSLKAGDKVNAGDTIGQIGNTGGSFGSHMHFEMRKNGQAVDPMQYINQWKNGQGINTGATSSTKVDGLGNKGPTQAEMIQKGIASFIEAMRAQAAINSIGAIKEPWTRDASLSYGHGNIRDILGTSGRTARADRVVQAREETYSARYDNVQQLKQLASSRAAHVSQANSALKAGKTDEYNSYKSAVAAIDNLVKTLEENNKKLADFDAALAKEQFFDPRQNANKASEFIRGGYDKVRTMTNGSVEYYRMVGELNQMNGEYLTLRKKTAMMDELWSGSGVETVQTNFIKRANSENETNLMYDKMKSINNLLSQFLGGTQDWYDTLEDAVALQQQLKGLEEQRLANAQSWFELTGRNRGTYIAQKAYTQSKDYNQDKKNASLLKSSLKSGVMENAYGIQTGWYNKKETAQKTVDSLKEKHNISSTIVKNKDGKYVVKAEENLTKKRADEVLAGLKKDGYISVGSRTGGGTVKMDANQQLATMQILAGLHDEMIQQMNDYRSAVVGAFKAGALSLDEYLKKLANLRDIQAEQRENAVKMVDSISQGFEQSLSEALSSGMMGNMDSTQGFMDSIKQTLASTVSAQLSNTLINNTGLQTVMTGLISSITTAATSGNPNDIANMFNENNFGEQIQNAMNPFLPLIEQIVASTDGIFAIMKDQLFNAPQGFKIDQYLYDQAKGKSFDGIKNWLQDGKKNETGSPIGGIGSNAPIVTPPMASPPTGVPGNVSTPINGTPTSTGKPENTSPGGTGAPDDDKAVKNPPKNTDKVNTPAPKAPPKSTKPAPTSTYTVKRGDTLSEIGQKLGIPWKTIASLNGIKSPYTLQIGQKLKVTGGSSGGGSGSSNSKTVKSAVNFRSAASYNGKVMSVLPKGAKVTYYGTEHGWAKVGYKGKTGYVGPSYIYHSGGIAGMMNFANAKNLKANEVQAIMQKGEIALQPKQLSSLLGHAVPQVPSGGGGDMNLNVTVNIEGGNYDQKGIESVVETSVEKAMSEFKRQARLGNLSWKGTSY